MAALNNGSAAATRVAVARLRDWRASSGSALAWRILAAAASAAGHGGSQSERYSRIRSSASSSCTRELAGDPQVAVALSGHDRAAPASGARRPEAELAAARPATAPGFVEPAAARVVDEAVRAILDLAEIDRVEFDTTQAWFFGVARSWPDGAARRMSFVTKPERGVSLAAEPAWRGYRLGRLAVLASVFAGWLSVGSASVLITRR